MPDIARLAATFLLIVLLLRKKVNIGRVMLLGAAFLCLLYLMPPLAILSTVKDTLTDRVTLTLVVALSLIRVFELILREQNILAEMMEASRALFGNRKAVIVSMPLLIGMLPSVGGAYFSAPMVDESTKDAEMSQEEKGFVNYWFRHPWEYVLPLYPGILLASAISGIELRTLILANLAYALVMGAVGFLFSMRRLGGRGTAPGKGPGVSGKGLTSFIPIGLVLALVVLLHVELHIALLIATVGLFAFYRYGPAGILRALKHGFSLDVIVLIIGVMLFKGIMESSGAVESLSRYLTETGIPLLPMLFLLPFATGILTGLTIGFVGSTFPLLVSLAGGSALGAVSFAFASGYMGVLLSPVHVCLVLTREYFKADMEGMYRRMVPPTAIVLAVAAAEYFLLRGM
jgi:integral membrane protein (TIGR00529 family)